MDEYKKRKTGLPAVTFCATFNRERRKERLKTYNEILVLDVDKLAQAEMERVKLCFDKDAYVFSFWESPSKSGIKGLVGLTYVEGVLTDGIDRGHRSAFAKLRKYFKDSYNIELDISGSDTTRLCFLSCDSSLALKAESKMFVVAKQDISDIKPQLKAYARAKTVYSTDRDALLNPKNKNDPNNRRRMSSIIKYLSSHKMSITNSYDEWYRVAYSIANTFTYDIGTKYFQKMSMLDGAKYDEAKCNNLLRYSYANNDGRITFNTIVQYAIMKGYKYKGQKGRGTEEGQAARAEALEF